MLAIPGSTNRVVIKYIYLSFCAMLVGTMKDSFEIRKAQATEADTLADLILAMAKESEGQDLDRSVLLGGIRSVFADPSLGTYWVIEKTVAEAGRAVLVANTLITVEWSDWNNVPYWWIQSLYIQPEYRSRGLFEMLLNHLEEEARRERVKEIRLYVEKNNARAIRAYARNGFEGEHYLCMTKLV